MRLEGVVTKINQKPYQSRRGSGFVSSFALREDSGSESWVTFGFDKEPPFEEGDRIRVNTTEKNGYLTYVEGSGEIIPKPTVSASTVGSTVGSSDKPGSATVGSTGGASQSTVSGYDTRAAKESDRQGQIVWQHSQDVAIAKIGLLLQHDGLPMSTAKTKASQAQRFAEISAAIDKETVKAYNDVLTRRVLTTVADPGVIDTSAADSIPADTTQKAEKTTSGDDDYG